MMKKTLYFTLILTAFWAIKTYAVEETTVDVSAPNSGKYELDAAKTEAYKLKEIEKEAVEETKPENAATAKEAVTPKIITENIQDGRIEKVVDENNRVIAEKTIINDKIVKKVLNYYYADGKLLRKITAEAGQNVFKSEEYYPNGQLSLETNYINEENKIGIEKKYDTNGVLRQEVPWALKKNDKEGEKVETVRYGNVVTYYPDGKKAAVFPIGVEGDTAFFGSNGRRIKEIKANNILKFMPELTEEDCAAASVHLSLDDLVELYEDEGDISYNKCGLPYRENFIYEVIDNIGGRENKITYDEIGMIRRITPYIRGKKHGTEQKFDASGNLTARVNYENGVKTGEAIGFFPTKEIAFKKTYKDGKVIGNLTCYYPSGEVAAQFSYVNGLKEGTGIVKSPVEREINFVADKIADNQNQEQPHQLASVIPLVDNPEPQCLNVKDRLSVLELEIRANKNSVEDAFDISIPQSCRDTSAYNQERRYLVCKDNETSQKVSISATYQRNRYVPLNIFSSDDKIIYRIPYNNQKRTGWSRKFNDNRDVIMEVYYNEGRRTGSSRSYYPNGRIKDLMTISEDAPRQIVAHYKNDGTLQFSVSFKNDKPVEAYIHNGNEGKDVVVRYYNGKMESIRESNIGDPYSFVEYNLALGEYGVYSQNELIKAGYLCEDTPKDKDSMLSLRTFENDNYPIFAPSLEVADAKKDTPVVPKKTEAETTAATPSPEINYTLENAIIPTVADKEATELASKNIGPVSKPDIEELKEAVQKETISSEVKRIDENTAENTEKLYYPNGNLRKTIKTKGSRTEEIKEYSKSGLLLTDIVYNADKIMIEKYNGEGHVRRKLEKSYDDNAVMAFLLREDYFADGNPRYEIKRLPETLLFNEKIYNKDGSVKTETTQKYVFSFVSRDYDKSGWLQKETIEDGINQLTKEYDAAGNVTKLTLNKKDLAPNLAANSAELLEDNSKIYDKNGKVLSSINTDKNYNILKDYYTTGAVKTEIIFYNNGELSVKSFDKNGTLQKFAYLAPDGKLHIEKPELRVLPAYRERYWVDYNNPRWVENTDKYSIGMLARLNLDTAAYILAELGIETPEMMKRLYKKY